MGCHFSMRRAPAFRHAKGRWAQISVETLLVFSIFIILVGIAYFATSKIGTGAQGRLEEVLSRNSFSNMASKLEEACRLGNGNVRIVEIQGDAATITSAGRGFSFTAKGFSGSANSSCEIIALQGQPAKSFRIENKGGTIEIS